VLKNKHRGCLQASLYLWFSFSDNAKYKKSSLCPSSCEINLHGIDWDETVRM